MFYLISTKNFLKQNMRRKFLSKYLFCHTFDNFSSIHIGAGWTSNHFSEKMKIKFQRFSILRNENKKIEKWKTNETKLAWSSKNRWKPFTNYSPRILFWSRYWYSKIPHNLKIPSCLKRPKQRRQNSEITWVTIFSILQT